jgi:hypothetical protein
MRGFFTNNDTNIKREQSLVFSLVLLASLHASVLASLSISHSEVSGLDILRKTKTKTVRSQNGAKQTETKSRRRYEPAFLE